MFNGAGERRCSPLLTLKAALSKNNLPFHTEQHEACGLEFFAHERISLIHCKSGQPPLKISRGETVEWTVSLSWFFR